MILTIFVYSLALSGSALAQESNHEEKGIARSVLPSATDSHIDQFTGEGFEHWVYYDPAATHRDQLFVFLPGTGGKGHGAKAVNNLAAREGFHVVSLVYPDNVSMSSFQDSDDPDCFLKARENILYGKAPYKRLATSKANSIHNRLVKLLEYLARQFPNEKWNQYLTDKGDLQWSKLVLAGQSQGGGHAALLGIQHSVARVLMFGSPKDFNIHFNKPAPWLAARSATPLERFFSFVHSDDEGHGCTYPQQLENYRSMKLLPAYPVINVDQAAAPYQHTRLLTSKKKQESPHTSVVMDREYREVWRYMLTEPCER